MVVFPPAATVVSKLWSSLYVSPSFHTPPLLIVVACEELERSRLVSCVVAVIPIDVGLGQSVHSTFLLHADVLLICVEQCFLVKGVKHSPISIDFESRFSVDPNRIKQWHNFVFRLSAIQFLRRIEN